MIDKVYHCPFHPREGNGEYLRDSEFRKPNPGMILQARDEFSLDLLRSVLVGDKESDIEAGRRAGVGTNILLLAEGRKPLPGVPSIRRLDEAVGYLPRLHPISEKDSAQT
jgi:D-glycero-D-manno-heptose 1,7-bisphosphate phosphatase